MLRYGKIIINNYVVNGLELVVILEEETEVLVGNVNVWVASIQFVQLHSFSSSREGVLVDLVLDLVWGVGHVDGGVLVTRTHLGVVSLFIRG